MYKLSLSFSLLCFISLLLNISPPINCITWHLLRFTTLKKGKLSITLLNSCAIFSWEFVYLAAHLSKKLIEHRFNMEYFSSSPFSPINQAFNWHWCWSSPSTSVFSARILGSKSLSTTPASMRSPRTTASRPHLALKPPSESKRYWSNPTLEKKNPRQNFPKCYSTIVNCTKICVEC